MNDYANFYRQIAELERQAERGNRRQRRSGAAWERTPEANAPQEVPRFSPQEVQRLERETEVESARQRARREYSPLPDEAGPLVPLTAMVGDLVQAPNDAILAREGDPRAQRRLGERDARWSRGAERAGQDILAEGHGGQIMQFFSDLPEQMDEAERARLEAGGRDAPLDRVGSVLGGLWTGMASAPREARGEVAAQDAIRAQHRDDAAEAMARGDDIGARSAALSGRMAEQAGDRSAGEDFWYNAPWAAEFVPGVGLVDMAASAGRFGARQGWRAAGQEIPEALARPQGFAETQRLGVRTGEVGANGEDILYSATGNARGWRNNAAAGGAAYLAADSADGELGDDPVASAAVGGGVMALGRRFIPNIDSAIPEEIQHLMRQGEIGPDGARNYTPRPGQRLTVDPEGRVAMDYQGSFNSGGGDSVEALSIARGAREALDDDIATTRRSEYSWTPNDERQAGFYRRTLGRTAPDGYAFSETPRGEMRLRRLGAEFEPDPLEAVPVADDAPFGFEGAPGAGRIIDAEATPVPARRFEAAIRDPETGRVYTGQDHYDAIASAPDDVQARLSEIYEARVEDQSVIGFQVDGQFMGREEGLQALRAQRRPVRIGEQVNRDGSVTPRSPIDWENGSNRLPADDEWFNTLAGMPTPPRMNIVPDGGIPGRSADDMLRDVPDAGQARIGQSGAQSDLFPETAPSPERVFHGTTGDFDPEQIAPWSHFGTERAARHRLEAQVDPQFRDSPDGPNMRVLPYEITGRRIDVGREFDTPGMENSPKDIADLLLRGRHITPEEHAWALEPHQGGARFEGRNADEVIWERLSELADRHDIGAIGYQNAVEDAGSRSYLVPNPRNVRAAPQEAPYGYYTGPDGVRRPMEPPLYTLTPAPDGGASGAGNAADRFRTNDTPVPVNEGWDTAGSLQQGVDDLAAQRGGWDTMGGRDMGEALIRRHGLDGALEQINRIMADPASRRARQRNGDQGAWEAVQRYIQASVNRRGIGLAPDAPNAGPRRLGGDDTPAAATISAGGLGGYALGEMLDDEAQAADGSESDGAMLPILTAGGGAAALYAMRRGRLGEQFGDSVGMSGGRGARRLGQERVANVTAEAQPTANAQRTAREPGQMLTDERLNRDQNYAASRAIDGASPREIADEMDTTAAYVRVLLSNARRLAPDIEIPRGRPGRSLDGLTERARALRAEGRSYEEIGEALNITPTAAKSRVNGVRADDASALAAIGLTGGGAALAFSGEAEAEETIDGMVIDREAELPSYTTAVGAPQAYGEYAVQEFSDGTRYVFRIDRSGPQVSLEPLGALRGMDAPSSRVGDVYQHQYDNSLPSEPYTPPPREEEPRRLGALRPALAAGAGVAASLLVPGRYGNATRVAGSGIATGAVDSALGGDFTESVPLAVAVASGGEILRYGADDLGRRLGTHGEDIALRMDPEFRARRDDFARTLPDELPSVRVMETENYHGEIRRPDEGLFGAEPFVVSGDEMAEQGYSYNRPVENMPTQREQFLDAEPAVQQAWMDRAAQPRLRSDPNANPERVAQGLDVQRRLGGPRETAAEAADPFLAPGSGQSVFGEPQRQRAPRAPLPPLAERAEAGGAQGAMRGVRVGPMREIADDLGIAAEGRTAGELRKSIVRELGRRFDSTREMVAFLARYGVTAAALGFGLEAVTDDEKPRRVS